MNLTGLQIFKYLPGAKKTAEANCKKCGFPTCMAYSLKLAQKLTTPDKCPYMPEELQEQISESMKRQQLEINFGINKHIKIGGETVLFRHEKTFVNRPPIAIILDSNDQNFEHKLKEIKTFEIDRIGEIFKIKVIYIKDNGNLDNAIKIATNYGFSIIIESTKDLSKYADLNIIAKSQKTSTDQNIIISDDSIDNLLKSSEETIKSGYKNIILEPITTGKTTSEIVQDFTKLRKLAVEERFEPATFPTLFKIEGKTKFEELTLCSLMVCKYASIIALDIFDKALLSTLFTLRQNIYTDPQKPLQVESKIYEINDPDENSIIMMTTNFALTYFAVANELESIGEPTYLIVTPSDGMSVLTAWSADKFTAEMVKKMLTTTQFAKKVKNRSIVIPGLLAHMKEELEETLEEWKIIVGTTEAYMMPEFVKELKNGQK